VLFGRPGSGIVCWVPRSSRRRALIGREIPHLADVLVQVTVYGAGRNGEESVFAPGCEHVWRGRASWHVEGASNAEGRAVRESDPGGRKGRPLWWGEPPMEGSIISERTFHLPVGIVTFMLTDVEGSTRLWESAADAMGAAVARHYELLDAAISLHGGVRPVEQGEGDSVVAAFTLASDALAAALDVQRAFCAEAWPGGAALKLRVALHTGEAQLRDEGNYFGRTVNCGVSEPLIERPHFSTQG
jgi:hypothetical protein